MVDIDELHRLIRFLDGAGPLDQIEGKWFGDHKMVSANTSTAFWWRKNLPDLSAALDELTALRAAQQWRGIESAPERGEAIFTIRVGGAQSQMHTQANGIDPHTALALATMALQDEARDAQNCPVHSLQPLPPGNGE